MLPITYGYARVSKADDDSRNLNQYQGGMCISGVLKTTERTPQHLISSLRPQMGGHRRCRSAICTFHLGFSLDFLVIGKGQNGCPC